MSFNLNLFITGLCAIVPNKKETFVVLPNARDLDHAGKPISPINVVERHIPMLCVPAKGLTSKRAGSFTIRAESQLAPTDLTAFPLDREDLTIAPVQASSTRNPLKVAKVSGCPTDASVSDFGWVANMSEVKATPLPAIKADPFPDGVALARLRITNGSWSTDNMATGSLKAGGQPFVLTWSYKDMMNMNGKSLPGSAARAMADIVSVEIPIDDPSRVTFHSSSSNGDVVVDGGGGDVIAYLVNIPLTVLVGTQTGVRQPETHFAHFYRLANPQPGMPMWIPAPTTTPCKPVGPGTQLIPHCPPAYLG